MYKIAFFVPGDYAESVKTAMFGAGAGRMGDYDHCSWQMAGEGQFQPLDSSRPFLGEKNQLNRLRELKVEMVCDEDSIRSAIVALKQAHPYEVPAYEVFQLVDI